MAIHILEHSQAVAAPVEECWRFFSDPGNLSRITPRELGFEVISKRAEKMYAGLMIEYRVRPLFGIAVTWLTEITQVEEGRRFVDEQRVGPYRIWHHEHSFAADGNGGTLMEDRVTYALPFPPFGEIAHPFLVLPQLRRIFDYRARVVREIFPGSGEAT
jgi:ligand-binding SRPBCC domain-containing protein